MKDTTKMYAIAGLISALAITSVAGTALTAFAQEQEEGEQCNCPCNCERFENMETRKEAIESGDYDAWVAAVTENGRSPAILEKINEDNFHLLGEMHQARVDGDRERAKEIADELGIKMQLGRRAMNRWRNVDSEVREQLREAVQNGDTEKAKEIAEQLGPKN
jgi:hypothetical protein